MNLGKGVVVNNFFDKVGRQLLVLFFLLIFGLTVFAHSAEDFVEGKKLIESKFDCKDLTEDQLKLIGAYLMEQMHPGEAHELMDKVMGLENDPVYDKKFHASLARTLYCNESGVMPMMGLRSMMGFSNNGSGMMGNLGQGFGMMNSTTGFNMPFFGYFNLFNVLYLILLIGIIALVYFGVFKLLNSKKKK